MGTHLNERPRLYVASTVIRLAASILWLAHRLYRAGFLDLTSVKYALGVSAKLRRVAWRLVRWKHHKKEVLK
jgi:hypothetical protein